MATPTHALSVNIYGRGDATLGDGPSHMGIAVYEIGARTCEMHHIRNPSDTDFIYDPRTQPLQEDPVLRGRCKLINFTSVQQKDHAARLLSNFGRNDANIPNSGVVPSGEGLFWEEMINLSAEAMQDRCVQSGTTWIPGPEQVFEGEADARFADKGDVKPVGRLMQNPALRERMLALEGGIPAGGSVGVDKGLSGERPFYVSSPFFSRTREVPGCDGEGASSSAGAAAERNNPSAN
ncbi:hypothetical protein ANOM_009071 [Aspergillus nomiae NRRL 13137]|uniref:Uncharacterized protein n=1 Tax=Aspergillus nomiae NRRL (strain ATCC 15546 / NRRL 13137 / CBS 260.88 / M93) TaxID=1509407 RepID=A0A0L1IQE2_ASPN3|nr:uncharacterized protein ANOM_009071 [Aspergillus nomiae NRRL 13137]KNG81806.1 hypothetical protein ANOM_009071 [Aspergillus nomiae NRRL 13137]